MITFPFIISSIFMYSTFTFFAGLIAYLFMGRSVIGGGSSGKKKAGKKNPVAEARSEAEIAEEWLPEELKKPSSTAKSPSKRKKK